MSVTLSTLNGMLTELHAEGASPDPVWNPAWNSTQQTVLDLLTQDSFGPTLVYGGPGSGKTSLAVRLALDFIGSGNDASRLLILSPTRMSAAGLRSRIERGLAVSDTANAHFTAQPSRSFSALAFWILGQAREFGVPDAPLAPRLLSGAEQDRVIGEELQRFADRVQDETSPWRYLEGALQAPKSLRKQIRDFFDRCHEYQVTPGELQAHHVTGVLGGVDRPEWRALGELFDSYLTRLNEQMPGVYDSSALVAAAEQMLASSTNAGHSPLLQDVLRQRIDLILVDDLQEAGPGVFRLLRGLGIGHHVIAFANPDTAVQGFRGARPDKLANWTKTVKDVSSPDAIGSMGTHTPSGLEQARAQVLTLSTSYRLAGQTRDFYTKSVERIGAVAALLRHPEEIGEERATGAAQTAPSPASAVQEMQSPGAPGQLPSTSVSSQVLASRHLADQYILQQVLKSRFHGVDWSRIAVVVRNVDRISRLGRLFTAHGVKVKRSVSELVLHQEEAVWPLLRIIEYATGDGAEQATPRIGLPATIDLLSSIYGGADAHQIRSIRQALIRAQRQAEAQGNPVELEPLDETGLYSSSDLLLVHAVRLTPATERLLETPDPTRSAVLQPLLAVRKMMRAAVHALTDPDRNTAEGVLWAVWHAADVAVDWQSAALGDSAAAERADLNLDAVLALFQTARRFLGQDQGNDAGSFVDYVQELDLPMDGLVDTGTGSAGVEIITPAAAAGREFHTVVLADLQDGEWPKVRPQGELLGASDLVAIKESGGNRPLLDLLAKRQESLMDEYRVFATAISRATEHVVLVAVEGGGEVPSSLYNLHHRPSSTADDGRVTVRRPLAQIPRLLEDRALVAELRSVMEKELRSTQPDELVVQAAADHLAALAEAGVPGADPAQWWGAATLSSTEPILSDDEPVSISPSSVGTAQEQPLQWFTGQAGGEKPRPFATELGTFIHDEIHQPYPDADEETLLAVLEAKWPEFATGHSWNNERERAQAAELVACLARYYQSLASRRRRRWVEELHLKQEFELDISGYLPKGSPVSSARRRAVVSGMADRIEIPADKDAPQGLYVVDLKTTSNPPKDHEVWAEYPQIGIYQLLIVSGAVEQAVQKRNTQIQEQLAKEGLSENERRSLQRSLISPAEVDGDPLDLAACAGAALLQLRRVSTHARALDPFQRQEPLTAAQRSTTGQDWWEDTWPMEHLRRAAAKMLHPEYEAIHEPGTGIGSPCYVGPLCPVCEENTPVIQRQWGSH